MPQLDPIALTQDLIRRPSVTPADEGAMDIVQRTLEGLGFACRAVAGRQLLMAWREAPGSSRLSPSAIATNTVCRTR